MELDLTSHQTEINSKWSGDLDTELKLKTFKESRGVVLYVGC